MTLATTDLLYPLSRFCESDGRPLPHFEVLDGAMVPEPYRSLLVHRGDMTSRLEEFHRGRAILRPLHREKSGGSYLREVVLEIEETGLRVEYGAIDIHLDEFSPELRGLIEEAHLPLGALLNRFEVPCHSEPKAFIKLSADQSMRAIFGLTDAEEFFGRCNELRGEHGRVLARIVEVLRPAGSPNGTEA